MSRNTLIGRLLTPSGFAIALGLFLLPFLTLSCSGPSSPSEDLSSADAEISATYTAVDLILDDDPTIELRQGGQLISIDASGLEEDPTAEQEPVPTKIRAPMIGAASAILVGLILAALLRAATVRKSLVAVLALGAAGALAYVIYVAAPDYVEEPLAEAGSEGLPPGVELASAPAIGFWAIVGVLAVVLVLQLIPTRPEPAAPALESSTPPPMQYGAPAGFGPQPAGQPPVADARPDGQ